MQRSIPQISSPQPWFLLSRAVDNVRCGVKTGRMSAYPLVQVALGGATGATLRYLTGVATTRVFGHGFPWGTITVNIVGSFIMGVVVVVLAEKGGTRFAPFIMVGLLGGFTTFSSFSLDVMIIFERGETRLAFAYVAASLILSLAAITFGMTATRWFWS